MTIIMSSILLMDADYGQSAELHRHESPGQAVIRARRSRTRGPVLCRKSVRGFSVAGLSGRKTML